MFSFSALFVTGLFCLLGGVVLGVVGLYSLRSRFLGGELEQRLFELDTEYKNYQRDVAEHFAHSAQLVNSLTQSYREIHEHLANGALHLATPVISKQLLEAGQAIDGKASLREQPIQPPRDWAPTKGTLSEDYGLHDERVETNFRPTESADDYDFDGKVSRY